MEWGTFDGKGVVCSGLGLFRFKDSKFRMKGYEYLPYEATAGNPLSVP